MKSGPGEIRDGKLAFSGIPQRPGSTTFQVCPLSCRICSLFGEPAMAPRFVWVENPTKRKAWGLSCQEEGEALGCLDREPETSPLGTATPTIERRRYKGGNYYDHCDLIKMMGLLLAARSVSGPRRSKPARPAGSESAR